MISRVTRLAQRVVSTQIEPFGRLGSRLRLQTTATYGSCAVQLGSELHFAPRGTIYKFERSLRHSAVGDNLCDMLVRVKSMSSIWGRKNGRKTNVFTRWFGRQPMCECRAAFAEDRILFP